MTTYREYRFTCVCGLHVVGRYPIDDLMKGEQPPALDRTKAACSMTKGQPSPAKGSVLTRLSPDPHPVGCGRTLAESDAEREAKRLAPLAVPA